jgi:L-alanine-DL-glutamate epimerase-like enolase superfamily enzyme
MKVVDVRFVHYALGPYERPFRNAVTAFRARRLALVEVHTDDGLVGIAPTLSNGRLLDLLTPQIVGEDPLDSSRLWHKMFIGWRKPVARGEMIAAIGSIDNALWDLRGKILGQPVYRLLGGHRSRVPVYASGGYYADGKDLDELAGEMAGFVADGYRSVKMKVGGVPFAEDVRRVETVREAIGPDIGLMIDANGAWKQTEAIRFVRAVEHCDLTWVEEPLWPDDLDGSAAIRQALDVPVAAGELEFTRWGFRELIDRRAVDIVQADPETAGGLSEWIRIAAYASAHHLPMAPHGYQHIGATATAAVDNGLIVESPAGVAPWRREFIKPLPIEAGEILLSDAPGLGLEIDRPALERAAEGARDAG